MKNVICPWIKIIFHNPLVPAFFIQQVDKSNRSSNNKIQTVTVVHEVHVTPLNTFGFVLILKHDEKWNVDPEFVLEQNISFFRHVSN